MHEISKYWTQRLTFSELRPIQDSPWLNMYMNKFFRQGKMIIYLKFLQRMSCFHLTDICSLEVIFYTCTHTFLFQNNCSPAQSIDFQATLNVFFTQQFNNVIRFLMNAEGK